MSDPHDHARRMHEMLHGYFVSQALYVMARLNIADLLAAKESTAEEIAAATHVHADALQRMLRALTGEGVLEETSRGTFLLTDLGRTLVSTEPGSMRAAALMAGQTQYKVWAIFQEVIKHGTPGFERIFRKPLFTFLNEHADIHALFDQTMSQNMAWTREVVLKYCAFRAGEVVVDVGGGMGGLLTAIHEKFPQVRPVLFETPAVAQRAREALPAAIDVIGGDFYERVPTADTAILACILHMHQDAEAGVILDNCAKALADSKGRVIIVEQVLRETNVPDEGKWADLNMMVMTGGRERTFVEYQKLLTEAGFGKAELVETGAPYRMVIAHREA